MTARARAYRATHDRGSELSAALPEVHAALEARAGDSPETIHRLAATVHLPVANVRAAVSSFDDTHGDPHAIRVCAGTSCMLCGGAALSRELSRDHPTRPVYCLGYCDRSPAAMTADGRVVPGLDAAKLTVLTDRSANIVHPEPPSIRCTARHAVITARIGQPSTPGAPTPAYDGLAAALRLTPEAVIEAVSASGVRGRGGAAYPTGNKWQLAARATGLPKFVVANGDEGDPGSFIDRELMERDPHAILEGMAICGHAIGASRGIVFIRSEYPIAAVVMQQAIADATAAGSLGPDALGRGKPFEVEVVRGMGSYVCGEETALLAAIEGQRGEVWPRPPYPVETGVFGRPTVVDNVETLVNMPWIMLRGSAEFAAMGNNESKGTKALCFNRGFAKPGIVEVEFGMPLREAIQQLGGGGAGGAEIEAVLLGGPMGSIVLPGQWDAPICFAGMAKRGINLGHGGMVAILRPADWSGILRHLLTFMRDESCGKCTPCRLGSTRVHQIAKQGLSEANRPEFEGILDLMKEASLCAFGRETPGPVRTILDHFGDRIFGKVQP